MSVVARAERECDRNERIGHGIEDRVESGVQMHPSKSNKNMHGGGALQAATSPAARSLARPPTTQSLKSTGSPQIWEQEVDDLLKWTEGLQQSDDPLDQSWGPVMSP